MYKILLFMLLIIMPNLCIADISVITDYDNAASLSAHTGMPLLVVFGSENCKHCKNLMNDIQKGNFDNQLDGYIICYVNTNDIKYENLIKNFKIKNIPDSRIFRYKNEKAKILGYDKKTYQDWLQNDRPQ